MAISTREERATGAIMGALIGDALGLGCHWYYDIEALHRDCGAWVRDYRDSDPRRSDRFGYIARARHEAGLRAGDLSQTGQIAVALLESLAECGGYHETDFAARLDTLFDTLDGSDLGGRYTDRAVRETWSNRRAGRPWGEAGSLADTAEAAIWCTSIAAACADGYEAAATRAFSAARLTHANPYITGYSTAYVLGVASLIDGVALEGIREHMIGLRESAAVAERTASVDITFQIGNEAARMGADPHLDLDPLTVCRLFGMNCTIGFLMPAAYFLIHRYPHDFEAAVLSAVNAGGNNMARAALTGALSGAMVGIEAIPERLLRGLRDHQRLLDLARRVAALGA